MSKKSLFIFIASILSAIAPFLEWGGVTLGKSGHFGFVGISSGYGKIILTFSIITILLAFLSYYLTNKKRLIDLAILILSTVSIVISLITMFTLNDVLELVNQLKPLGVSASVGIGLILSLASSLIVFGICLSSILSKEETDGENIPKRFSFPKIPDKYLPKVPKKYVPIVIPLVSTFLGILLGAIIMWIFGFDALWGYEELFRTAFGSIKNVGEIFRTMGPLILIALGFAVASRAGFFNVGLPGQALAGWIAAVWFALSFPNIPRILMIPLTVLVAAIAGGVIGLIPGLLRAFLGTSEVIVTIMMNYIVLFAGNEIIRNFPKKFMANTESTITVSKNASYKLSFLTELTKSRMNIGIFIALIAVAVVWFIIKKTTLGFEIRSVGLNPNASDYAGMSAKRTIILSMVISGALCGIGGAVEGIGTFQNVYVQAGSLAIGFNGMAVALLASNSPIGIVFAAFLLGTLQTGAPGMTTATIPPEFVNIVTASIIFFVSAHYIIEKFIRIKEQMKGVE
ncbi:sugar ABC transporter permease [Streptococcus australis]|uniref:Sugar ABC transporter permease n=1 Tax=Streptococcus viridans TaxID=78535 RepID=A0A447Z5F8_9STRE|nr:sugar ABC transporter permease [Streptococcus viridans]VEE19569.1 sugar ABC transporter permease [Streptococcus australis]